MVEIKNIRFVYQADCFFGGTIQREETTWASKDRIKKCFTYMLKHPWVTALWVNYGNYSIGYWYDNQKDYENGYIRKTFSSNTHHRTEWCDVPVKQARADLYGDIASNVL